ncbi:MAG TPA: hypothetical protein VJQ82_14670, partial [Terriglobales bacterium]|nr:hypothetical protein [Terriglobales bacterium]
PRPFERNNQGGWDACSSDELFSWCQQMLADGRSFLRLQPAYKYISDGMDIINGEFVVTDVQSLSNVKTEQTARNTKEIVAAQTNLRIIPAFKAEAEEYTEQNAILNKGFMAWQNMTFADRRLRGAWQFATAGGTGYIGTRYDPNYYYRGKGDIVWERYGPLDVIPLALPPDLNLQGAYAVAMRKAMPIHQVWRMFPLQRDNIRANRVTTAGKGMVIAQAVKFASAVLKRWSQGGMRQSDATTTWDNTDVYYIYVDDDSVNETGAPLQITGPDGQWGTSWSYVVPYVGQEIHTGRMLAGGKPETRTAKREDCLIYPNRRLIIATDSCVLNPAPENQSSYRWDGRVPAVQFRCDDWAWNFLGFPATRYGQSMEKLGIELWRGLGDQMNLSLNPAAFYDRGSTATAMLQTMNPRVPGLRVGLDMSLNPAQGQFTPVLPYQWLQTQPAHLEAVSKIIPAIIKDQMGVADVSAMARARQLPSGDSTERLLEAMGPLVKDQSRNMEEGIRALGEMWKSDWFQFATAKRRMQILGPEGLAEEDFDYDPGTLIPLIKDPDNPEKTLVMTQAPNGTWLYDPTTNARMPELGHNSFERARWHKNNFTFSVTPYSLHELNSTTRKLFTLQLMKVGFPVSWWTLAEQFDIKNFGPCMFKDPETGELRPARNEIERYTVQLEIQARIAQAMGAGGGGGKGKGPKGRPETFQRGPALEQKSGGNATVRTSAH